MLRLRGCKGVGLQSVDEDYLYVSLGGTLACEGQEEEEHLEDVYGRHSTVVTPASRLSIVPICSWHTLVPGPSWIASQASDIISHR